MNLNERIQQLCDTKGLKFKPWEITPYAVTDEPSPYPRGSMGAITWPKAQAMRARLIKELEQS